MPFTDYIERGIAFLTYRLRGHDSDLFTRQEPFHGFKPSITVTSTVPDEMPLEYIATGGSVFPPLRVRFSYH